MKEFQQKYMQCKSYYHVVTIKEKIKIVISQVTKGRRCDLGAYVCIGTAG